MNLQHAALIAEAAEELGLQVSVRQSYSGRGMYGRTTAAVVGSIPDILQAAVQAGVSLARDSYDGGEPKDTFAEEFVQAVGGLSFDSMGRETVAY